MASIGTGPHRLKIIDVHSFTGKNGAFFEFEAPPVILPRGILPQNHVW